MIVSGFILLIGVSVFLIGIGSFTEYFKGRSKNRALGEGPAAWLYLIINDTESLTNDAISKIVNEVADNGFAVVPNNIKIEFEVTIHGSGLLEVRVTDAKESE